MPFSLKPCEGFLTVIGTGEITGQELLLLHADLAGEAQRYDKCLIDFSSARVSQVSPSMAKDLAALPPRFNRLAIVAERGPAYTLARGYQSSATSDRIIGVFMAANDAIGWLLRRPR